MNEHFDIIETIHLSEKTALLGEKLNKYVFRVSPRATKLQIKVAVEKLFGKTVLAVNTANFAGKKKRQRQSLGRRTHWKKAVVTLKEGDKIDLA